SVPCYRTAKHDLVGIVDLRSENVGFYGGCAERGGHWFTSARTSSLDRRNRRRQGGIVKVARARWWVAAALAIVAIFWWQREDAKQRAFEAKLKHENRRRDRCFAEQDSCEYLASSHAELEHCRQRYCGCMGIECP